MNLHIVPDNVFSDRFISNLHEAGLSSANKIVARSNEKSLKRIKHNIPFAKLYSSKFDELIGDTSRYDKVFIHQFTPLLYRWVAQHDIQNLGWMIWGSDLYNLQFLETKIYEKETMDRWVRRRFDLAGMLYRAKVFLLHDRYRDAAYAKVTTIYTWMESEYNFALRNIPALKARHEYFFYENDLPYQELDVLLKDSSQRATTSPLYVLGNSSTAELNHLDAIALMNSKGVQGDLWVPLSYGDNRYRSFISELLLSYRGGRVNVSKTYLPFEEYLKILEGADGLIMNNRRPQGYGNIFMMMYLGKKIFLNKDNISTFDLDRLGMIWRPLEGIGVDDSADWSVNRKAVMSAFNHQRLMDIIRKNFC